MISGYECLPGIAIQGTKSRKQLKSSDHGLSWRCIQETELHNVVNSQGLQLQDCPCYVSPLHLRNLHHGVKSQAFTKDNKSKSQFCSIPKSNKASILLDKSSSQIWLYDSSARYRHLLLDTQWWDPYNPLALTMSCNKTPRNIHA